MANHEKFDVIVVGGSYAGLGAAMALGRALKRTLIIDSGRPCNASTPYSHNFLTQDGSSPAAIAKLAKQQVENYNTIKFFNGKAIDGQQTTDGFEIKIASGEKFFAKRLIFATGIKDLMPNIEGFAECWGISVLHCPYCHGYEVKNEKTGILGNGAQGYELAKLISNWTKALTLFTNGDATLTLAQTQELEKHQIKIVEKEVIKLAHQDGHLQQLVLADGAAFPLKTLYTKNSFEQHCKIPEALGCELTDDGYLKIDQTYETTVNGVFACGDNAARLRTVANAVASGTATGINLSKKMIFEEF